MARLRFKDTTPPRGFTYIQPESRLKIEGENYDDLMQLVLKHRFYKGFPRRTKEEVILDVERQICSRLSLNECISEGPDDVMRPVNESQVLTISTVTKFSKAALDWLATGAKVVDMAQMKRRQAVCLACPLNNPVPSCSCSVFYKMVNALVPAARRDEGLFICSACSCSLNAKTQMPLEMILKSDEGRNIRYAPGCWVTEEQA